MIKRYKNLSAFKKIMLLSIILLVLIQLAKLYVFTNAADYTDFEKKVVGYKNENGVNTSSFLQYFGKRTGFGSSNLLVGIVNILAFILVKIGDLINFIFEYFIFFKWYETWENNIFPEIKSWLWLPSVFFIISVMLVMFKAGTSKAKSHFVGLITRFILLGAMPILMLVPFQVPKAIADNMQVDKVSLVELVQMTNTFDLLIKSDHTHFEKCDSYKDNVKNFSGEIKPFTSVEEYRKRCSVDNTVPYELIEREISNDGNNNYDFKTSKGKPTYPFDQLPTAWDDHYRYGYDWLSIFIGSLLMIYVMGRLLVYLVTLLAHILTDLVILPFRVAIDYDQVRVFGVIKNLLSNEGLFIGTMFFYMFYTKIFIGVASSPNLTGGARVAVTIFLGMIAIAFTQILVRFKTTSSVVNTVGDGLRKTGDITKSAGNYVENKTHIGQASARAIGYTQFAEDRRKKAEGRANYQDNMDELVIANKAIDRDNSLSQEEKAMRKAENERIVAQFGKTDSKLVSGALAGNTDKNGIRAEDKTNFRRGNVRLDGFKNQAEANDFAREQKQAEREQQQQARQEEREKEKRNRELLQKNEFARKNLTEDELSTDQYEANKVYGQWNEQEINKVYNQAQDRVHKEQQEQIKNRIKRLDKANEPKISSVRTKTFSTNAFYGEAPPENEDFGWVDHTNPNNMRKEPGRYD